ncbi:helix-turn-helix transcriptional regulator [Mycobacteroides abscessus]|uniref:helix-turn-helix transcriptional regulator n=1 Tax=Mycobacteroides abscessus TaxID=36809 RepID=UPI00140408EB|nr:helix-turn-helix transcriptional regulator [Mycobacteroides abscessus]
MDEKDPRNDGHHLEDQTVRRIEWDNTDAPSWTRLQTWCQRSVEAGDRHDFLPVADSGKSLLASARGLSTREALLLKVHSTAIQRVLTPESAQEEPLQLMLVVRRGSSSRLSVRGQQLFVPPGALVVVDSKVPHSFVTPDPFTAVIVVVNPDKLCVTREQLDPMVFRPIVDSPALVSLLCSSADFLLSARAACNIGLDTYLAGMADYIVSALDADPAQNWQRVILRSRIELYIRQHCSNLNLSAASIGRALHTSPRALYRLFEKQPESLTQLLRRVRAERAHSLITSPNKNMPALEDIARESGFGSVRSLTRAYVYVYGITPAAALSTQWYSPSWLAGPAP